MWECITLTTTALVFLIIFMISWFIIQRIQAFNYFTSIQIPCPDHSFLFGNTRQLLKSKDPIKLIREWRKKYGTVFGYYEGCRPSLIITDPDIIKEIMVKEFHNFPQRTSILEIGEPFDKLLAEATGDTWKRIRITLSPAFTGNKLKQMSRVMDEPIKIYLDILKELAAKEEEFDISDVFGRLTVELIGESVFALKIGCQREKNNEFYQNIRNHFQNVFQSNIIELMMIIPGITSFFSKIMYKFGIGKMMKTIKWVLGISEKLIKERQLNPQTERIDMTQLMINAVNESLTEDVKDIDPDKKANIYWNVKKGLTNDELAVNTLLFLLAGSESTYNTTSFVAHQLAIYPDIQRSVQEEIDNNVSGEIPTYEEMQKLHYLDGVINETLRILPPAPIFLSRFCYNDCIIKGIHFKKGMSVHCPPAVLHFDEEYWSEPQIFDPTRFLFENKGNIVPMTYLPFGAGPRNCIGQRLALLEVKIALVSLLKNYTIKKGLHFETAIKMQTAVITRVPKNGIQVQIRPRHA